MPCTREQLEQRERQTLAPFAQLSAQSRGRVHPEPSALWRTEYQRDRDRVIHSRSFRRLEYKTQVFLNGTGDHLRTRLTHSIEVAAIARNIARALNLNEDLAETIALAHDLGHPPFGHKGEDILNQLMRQDGGFEHNRQSLRIVEELEVKYPGFRGLNLTWETREGLAKHRTPFDHPSRRRRFAAKSPSLEAQVANLATNSPIAATTSMTAWKPASSPKKSSAATSNSGPRPPAPSNPKPPGCPTKPAANSSSAASLTSKSATSSRPPKPPSSPPASSPPMMSASNPVPWSSTAPAAAV